MADSATKQKIIDELYNRYLANGFITEDEALACFVVHKVPLHEIDSITEHLLTMGVIIKYDDYDNDEDVIDRSQINYDELYGAALDISPGLHPFIDYVRNARPPQNREWQTLIKQLRDKGEYTYNHMYAFNRLFDMYLRVVIKIALRFHKDENIEIDDAIQEGALGLLLAIEKYDIHTHGNFGSYLPWWIRQSIGRAIADQGRTIRIPVHMYETIRNVIRASKKLDQELDHTPTSEEIATVMDIQIEEIHEILKIAQVPLSLDAVDNNDGDRLMDILPDDDTPIPLEVVCSKLLRENIVEVLHTLPVREKEVLHLRFGLDNSHAKTLEEVGIQFNVTRERIRQIEAKALRRLRHPSRSKKLKDFY